MPLPARQLAWLSALAALLAPAAAPANGMPILPGPMILAPEPMQQTAIQLVSEDLVLEIGGPDLYTARATYHLRNAGPPASVAYGVPISFPGEGLEGTGDLEATADSIQISIAAPPPSTKVEAALKCRLQRAKEPGALAWCVTTLRVPQGDSLLRLSYASSMDYGGSSTSKSPISGLSDAHFSYPLAPAGYWAGPVEHVGIVIRGGKLADDLVVSSPPGWVRQKDTFVLRIDGPDLKQLPPVEVTLRQAARNFHEQVVKLQPLREGARASSVLAPQGHFTFGPLNAIDGDPGTAWCEGAPGAGVGQWIEVRAEAPKHGCWLYGYVLTPGFVRDQQTWLRNARPTKVRVDSCEALGKGRVSEVKLERRFDESAQRLSENPLPRDLTPPAEDQAPQPTYCVRLTILEVEPGVDPDACISEFRPIFACGD
jgi:hypothetical protein